MDRRTAPLQNEGCCGRHGQARPENQPLQTGMNIELPTEVANFCGSGLHAARGPEPATAADPFRESPLRRRLAPYTCTDVQLNPPQESLRCLR
jgi:hypothetical protein